MDSDTRIQVLETMSMLPQAEKEQCAAFIVSLVFLFAPLQLTCSTQRDERVLVVWSDSLHAIIPAYQDLEQRLIKILWHPRPRLDGSTPGSSVTFERDSPGISRPSSRIVSNVHKDEDRDENAEGDRSSSTPSRSESRNEVDISEDQEEKRPVRLLAPIYTGISAGLAFGVSYCLLILSLLDTIVLVFMGASISE